MSGRDSMTQDEAHALALQWATVGVPAFPVKLKWDGGKEAISKEPLTFHSHQDATTDPVQLRGLFNGATLPTGWCWGVGLHLGPKGWMALDVDTKNGHRGDEELLLLEEKHGKFPDTPRVITASGGEHVWLDKGSRHVDNTDLVDGEIEVRSDNGWTVAPGVYTPWGRWDFDDAGGDVLEGAEVAPAPAWIFDILAAGGGGGSSNGNGNKSYRHWRQIDLEALHPADRASLEALRRLGGHGEHVAVTREADDNGEIVVMTTIQITRPGNQSGTSATIGYVGPGAVKVFTPNWTLFKPNAPGPRLRKATYHADQLAAIADAVEAGDKEKAERLTDPSAELYDLIGEQEPGRHNGNGTKNNPFANDGKQRTKGQPLKLIPISSVDEQTVYWTSYPRIPQGKVVILGGDPGVGKGFLMARMTADITRGKPLFPDQIGTAPEPASVVIVEYEDGTGDTVKPRLRAAGADQTRVYIPDMGVDTFTASDVPALDQLLEDHPDVRMLFISPVGSFVGGKTDTYRDNEVRDVLTPLADLAERRQVTVVLIMHLNKTSLDTLLYKLSESIAFTGISRSVLVMGKERDGNRHGVVHVKSNLSEKAGLLEYRIESVGASDGRTFPPAVLRWNTDTQLTEDVLFGTKPGPKPVLRQECEDWLAEALGSGPRRANELLAEGKDLGFTQKVVYSAAKEVGVAKAQKKDGWWWEVKPVGGGL